MPASPSALAPLAILGPPDTVPSEPPTVTRVQLLPFGALTWENFERLCHRLTALGGDVEHCARYGRQGDAQEGIDIFARQVDGRYQCLQAKRHQSFNAAKIRSAVELFVAGNWFSRTARFTIAVQASLRSPEVQEEIERQAKSLRESGIVFAALDGEDLTEKLRSYPAIVDDFFGRPWVAAVLGDEVASSLGARLDGGTFARVRSQLARVYAAQFQSVDPGSFGSLNEDDGRPALSLLERFLKLDMLMRESSQTGERSDHAGDESEQPIGGQEESLSSIAHEGTRHRESASNSRMRRLPLAEWLGDSQRLVVLGDAGCGKSTLLRVIALDLLNGQTHFPELADRWGQHIPIYVPFARWVSQVAQNGSPIGIKEIVRNSLEHLLTVPIVNLLDRAIDEKRIVLLVDGLDEWSIEQAARTTLSTLVTTVEAHELALIVSGRPRGLSRIGSLPANWRRGTVAPLSVAQQKAIAQRWFERHGTRLPETDGVFEASLRTGRFMAELARDANLGALAVVPLLLIGLVTLALRGQILPRTRADIYDQLVRILLEVHPDRRATASGDTGSRFRYATDPDQRRAALARLSFAVREQTGGAGMALLLARDILRTYLSSSHGFDLPEGDAAAAASEILSVNAETQGLLVEKLPGEVGFVHASFEEFLCAEYVGRKPFNEIEAFVRACSGEGRWRNVVSNLLSSIQRRDEFDRLVAIIETSDTDELSNLHRQALLGDIAFGTAMRAPATAKRLAIATMNRVESEDWPPARREALASVLKGAADSTLKVDIELRLKRWVPGRDAYLRASLITAFEKWQPSARLQDLLFTAMCDESRRVQRAAAATYAKVFSPCRAAFQRLVVHLGKSRNLASACAMLECLAQGWHDAPAAAPLFQEAWQSHSGDMRLIGVLGLAAAGKAMTNVERDVVLLAQSWHGDVSYEYRELSASILAKYWPGDDELIRSALARATAYSDGIWEHDAAISYLLEQSVERIDVRAWILAELRGKFPFSVTRDEHVFSHVGRFAAVDAEIRAAANAFWFKSDSRAIGIYKLPAYVAEVADAPMADTLIEMLSEKTPSRDRYWALMSLLVGWGSSHPKVKTAIEFLRGASDEDMCDLVDQLPEIMADKQAARLRLIRMGARPDVRRDLLAKGLHICGCDSNDDEAVAAIFSQPQELRGIHSHAGSVIRWFGAHVSVRALATELMRQDGWQLSTIASSYADDPEFESELFNAALALPLDLRAQIVEIAATGVAGTALGSVLGHAAFESDPELRARIVIVHHSELRPELLPAARQALLSDAVALGYDNDITRAAALAGLITIDALDGLVPLEDLGKPVALSTGRFNEHIDSVERLICEKYDQFRAIFGDSLAGRFKSFGSKNRLAEILSAAPSASQASRNAFLELAESGEMPLTPRSLRALATELPHSELLLKRCLDALGSRKATNDHAMFNADIGLILRGQFADSSIVRDQLIGRLKGRHSVADAIALAIFDPQADELGPLASIRNLGREFADWTVTLHMAISRADSAFFASLLEAMVTRPRRSQFDAQNITNLAVRERLQRDPELVDLLTAKLERNVNPSVSGSCARYLAAAGQLNIEGHGKAIDLLHFLGGNQRLPMAGYDAIADQWRATRATLLEAVSAGLELN